MQGTRFLPRHAEEGVQGGRADLSRPRRGRLLGAKRQHNQTSPDR